MVLNAQSIYLTSVKYSLRINYGHNLHFFFKGSIQIHIPGLIKVFLKCRL